MSGCGTRPDRGWIIGAIGVTTRAWLGHTGLPLTATRQIRRIYVAAVVAAVARTTAAFDVLRELMPRVSAIACVIAFAGYVIVYVPSIARRSG